MAKLNELQKYLNYEFSTGCYTGNDYKSFQTKYINFLKDICSSNNWKLVNVGKNHYCFSAFIKGGTENKYVYISISDVFWCFRFYRLLLLSKLLFSFSKNLRFLFSLSAMGTK